MTTKETERQEATERVSALVSPGDTVYCLLRGRARSGMSRTIDLLVAHNGGMVHIGFPSAKILGWRYNRDKEGIHVNGCGMDMGFHTVYSLSYCLNRDGFGCVGERCPSNDHSNGDRDYTPHGSIGGCIATKRRPVACVCHDESSWTPGTYPNGCSSCGCHRIEHWHKDGGYALRSVWL